MSENTYRITEKTVACYKYGTAKTMPLRKKESFDFSVFSVLSIKLPEALARETSLETFIHFLFLFHRFFIFLELSIKVEDVFFDCE